MRTRANSPRCLIIYRAAEGKPPKRKLTGKLGKIEVLGAGQQFVAFGIHLSGATLEWFPEAPGDITAWVRTFQEKVRQIADRPPCPSLAN